LDEVLDIVRSSHVTALVIGGVAAAVFGRPRWSDDVDLFVRAEDAARLLRALGERGFDTDETFPDWLYKAFKSGVLIDLIFKSAGDIYLDAEMVERSCAETFHGRTIPVVSPEDLVVMKAIAHSEPTARYWYDALGILSRADLDWDYLLRRARQGPHRVLSLLLYARSNDIAVPDSAIERLLGSIRGEQANDGPADRDGPSVGGRR
jgi:predicted nucleotidyltransferase